MDRKNLSIRVCLGPSFPLKLAVQTTVDPKVSCVGA